MLEGLAPLGGELDAALAGLAESREQWRAIPHRARLLEVNDRYAIRLLELQREWLADVERTLKA